MNPTEDLDTADAAEGLVALYDRVLPEVYGYLIRRCGSPTVAEDLTAETFMAAAAAVRRVPPTRVEAPWLMTVARNKLVDHWRREARRDRALRLVALPAGHDEDELGELSEGPALEVLRTLAAPQRAALMLRHLDGLSVPEVAELLGRSVQATDALLSRGRVAFRRAYLAGRSQPGTDDRKEVGDDA